jgi:hypothetical protein
MTPAASIMGEILFIALASEKHNGLELKNVAEQVLQAAYSGRARRRRSVADRRRHPAVPGDGEARHGWPPTLTLDEVLQALRDSNQNASAGFYVESGQEYLIQGLGRINVLDDIADTVVAVRDGQPVLIRHVADVGIGSARQSGVSAPTTASRRWCSASRSSQGPIRWN